MGAPQMGNETENSLILIYWYMGAPQMGDLMTLCSFESLHDPS